MTYTNQPIVNDYPLTPLAEKMQEALEIEAETYGSLDHHSENDPYVSENDVLDAREAVYLGMYWYSPAADE